VAIRRGGLYFVVHIALMIRECLRAPRRNWKLRVFVRLYFFSPTPSRPPSLRSRARKRTPARKWKLAIPTSHSLVTYILGENMNYSREG